MPTVVYALAKHDDVAKFELEDGLARHTATELLSAPSSIAQIITNFPRAESPATGFEHRGADVDALFAISAEAESDAHPASFDGLIVDVARVVGAWTVTATEIAQRTDTWVGSATTGANLSVLFSRGPGIDQNSYDAWLRDVLMTAAESMDGTGISHFTTDGVLVGGDGFDTWIEFSFPSEDALTDAFERKLLAPLITSKLFDENSVRVFASVQHVHVPNENAWQVFESNHSPKD